MLADRRGRLHLGAVVLRVAEGVHGAVGSAEPITLARRCRRHRDDRIVRVVSRRSSRRTSHRRSRRCRRRPRTASSPCRSGSRPCDDRLVQPHAHPLSRRNFASPNENMPPSAARRASSPCRVGVAAIATIGLLRCLPAMPSRRTWRRRSEDDRRPSPAQSHMPLCDRRAPRRRRSAASTCAIEPNLVAPPKPCTAPVGPASQ